MAAWVKRRILVLQRSPTRICNSLGKSESQIAVNDGSEALASLMFPGFEGSFSAVTLASVNVHGPF